MWRIQKREGLTNDASFSYALNYGRELLDMSSSKLRHQDVLKRQSKSANASCYPSEGFTSVETGWRTMVSTSDSSAPKQLKVKGSGTSRSTYKQEGPLAMILVSQTFRILDSWIVFITAEKEWRKLQQFITVSNRRHIDSGYRALCAQRKIDMILRFGGSPTFCIESPLAFSDGHGVIPGMDLRFELRGEVKHERHVITVGWYSE